MKKYRGNIIDVVKKRIFKGEVIVADNKIADIVEMNVEETQYILPGFINSHVHIESSMLTPSAFALLAVQHGTVGVVSDPHEIANVMGVEGVKYMIEDGKKVPLKFYFGAPSCVPATPMETSGANLGPKEVQEMLEMEEVVYLSEMMNFPGVVNDDTEVHEKLKMANKLGLPIDGHAPGLSGDALKKYVESGITTDHECVNEEEAVEKIEAGMTIQIREGSAAKNFDSLFGLIDKYPDQVMICTDDSHPDDLIKGHINTIVKNGLEKGADLFNILRATSYNVKKHYNLNVGLLQKNDPADFIIIDNLFSFTVQKTVIDGTEVYKYGKSKFRTDVPREINNFSRSYINDSDLQFVTNQEKLPVINVIDGELLTTLSYFSPEKKDGSAQPDLENDILKIVVVNRYKDAPLAIGFIKGFEFKKGAICSSVAHDSHNIVAVGTNDEDLRCAINKVVEMKGGIALANDGGQIGLELEIAGLMTNMNGYEVAEKYKLIESRARELGTNLKAPFMTLAFMTLLPIPEIKISDKGVFDVNTQKYFNF